ncbi:small-conductance mechanosensitive channel MscS [Buchnera aphidicola]|uniref:small-conductance mechanosensitive channel MscS n=1 Tax=Buchnera aphidicola TaxID=9 RepID=UPI0034645C14
MERFNFMNNIKYFILWAIQHQELVFNYFINATMAIIIIVIGSFTSKILSNGLNKILISRNVDITICDFLTALSKYVVITLTIVIALGRIGVQTTSVIAILGAAGMAAGLALQGALSNFAAGILLVVLSPLKNGEYIVVKNVAGTVLNVHIFYTTLRTLDGKIVIIPNNKITSDNIINYSREPARRNEFMINVSYNTNIDLVINTLKQVISKEPRVLKDKDIVVGLSELAPSSMNFIVRCWSYTNDLNAVYWDLMSNFKKALDKNKIDPPYPQLQMYIKNKHQKIEIS